MAKRLIPFQPDILPQYCANDVLDSVQHFNRLADMRADHWPGGDYSPQPFDLNSFAGNIGWDRVPISNAVVMASLETADVPVMPDANEIGRLMKTLYFKQET
jgi:hypothetical protein